MLNYTGRESIIKDIVKRAMNKAQVEIDEQLKELANKVVQDYYEDYDLIRSKSRWRYKNTYEFMKKSYFLTHHQNIANNGLRHYRYIHLWFSPEKIPNDNYRDYYGKVFSKEKVFYQNFFKGYHGRVVFSGKNRNNGFWITGKNKVVPIKQLDKYWNELRKSDFNKMFENKIEDAIKEIGEELDKEFEDRLFKSKKIGGWL